MKLSFYLTVATCMLAFPQVIQAGAGWTDYARIAELVPSSRHYYEVQIPVKDNPSGCRNTTWFYQDHGLDESDKMYDTLLDGRV